MQQFKQFALFFVVCSLYCSYAAAAGCTDDGFYVVEEDCNRYYRCDNKLRSDYTCPAGLHFDTNTFTCTWPQDANCKNSGIKQTPWKPNKDKKPSKSTTECPKGDGYSADEKDCSRFYACAEGIRHYYNCPTGLKYNVDSNSCVEPANAKCN